MHLERRSRRPGSPTCWPGEGVGARRWPTGPTGAPASRRGGAAVGRLRARRAPGGRPGRVRHHRPPRPAPTTAPRARPTDGFFDDLAPGSYVVHRQHGVARYAGVTTRTVAGATRDYLVLEYRGSDRLYLPVDQIEAVTPYTRRRDRRRCPRWAGPTGSAPGPGPGPRPARSPRSWSTSTGPGASVAGHAFAPDTPWQRELEAAFPYTETPDQQRAIAEVKADMESERPMDRLVCGDVGFGKTEVALRAVFKAVQDGRQAAVLVPTTLLASQHFADVLGPLPGVPGAGRDAEPVPLAARRRPRWSTA